MHLQVLGSGDVTSSRLSPCYLIDEAILIDMAPGAAKRLISLGHPMPTIENVLVTHFHADHFFDLFYLFLAHTKLPQSHLTVYGGASGAKEIDGLMRLAYPDLAGQWSRFHYTYTDASRFSLGSYIVTRFEAVHGKMPECFGYLFEDGRTKVGFSGDCSMTEQIRQVASQCQHFVLECSVPKGQPNHIGLDDIEQLLAAYPTCHFYTTHMSEPVRSALLNFSAKNLTVLDDLDEFMF